MDRMFKCFAIGLILIFVIQVLHFFAVLSDTTFIRNGEVVASPINFTYFIIPTIFFSSGIIIFYLSDKSSFKSFFSKLIP
ncbi:hypothetical protein [Alkalihalobacillus trypoxylicola]|uniref:DUF3955 domain-containing protein n=1 Tax=Alkalihalobacillus trypoxylicola TaxID=519424 RepID=A0A162D502_9BACI|nr:hypothetical protein [Alkalihalobacillus trypoxylicola]KYG28117.1 hypothetical protein AZF04_09445 [Alkalihalobacillus trypoxylicola]